MTSLRIAGVFRHFELVPLLVAELVQAPDGFRVAIRRSKTGQEGQGQEVAIPRGYYLRPVEPVQTELAAAEISSDPVFRPVQKGGRVQPVVLLARQVAAADRAGLDPAVFAGHSLRSGFFTSAAKAVALVFKMMGYPATNRWIRSAVTSGGMTPSASMQKPRSYAAANRYIDAEIRGRAAIQPANGVSLMLRYLLTITVTGWLAGCATPPPASDTEAVVVFNELNDPLEPTNRAVYRLDDGLHRFVLRPIAQTYRYVIPGAMRSGIHNVLNNLGTPVKLSNDILDGKPRRAGDTIMRFLINTSFGILGIADVAAKWGYPDHDADFGITLALWGLPEGPYLFLPGFGPSNPRDAAGLAIDVASDPFNWLGQGAAVSGLRWSHYTVIAIDQYERRLDDIDSTRRLALDPYATFRTLYRQNRQYKIDRARVDQRATIPVWFKESATPDTVIYSPSGKR